jgi:FkbM family methyltransferase
MQNINDLDTAGLSIQEISTLYNQTIFNKDYDWWYEIEPGSTVVDIGAGIGLFSKKALDAGAGKVLMIEPNKRLLKAAIKNCSDHMIDTPPEQVKVKAINAAIGKDIDRQNIYKSNVFMESEEDVRLMSLAEITYWNQLEFIDYLKIDAWGAEYNILSKEILPFCMDRTRFIAIRVYLDKRYNSKKVFEKWREEILTPLKPRLLFKDYTLAEKLWLDDWESHLPVTFMLYVKNW